ncbi:MAG: hypothetical protein K0R65_1231 [Crocinitomicaceae bacterium]|jgi:hypothetical protein|nr:hypothetical protein [Crocinitomicaceae bacterium]
MKKLIYLLPFLFFGTILRAQDYNTAIGLRAGETSGLTIKKSIGNSSALEGILGFWRHGVSATLLYERYMPTANIAGLSWYYGGGGHAAFENTFYRGYYWYNGDRYYYYENGGMGLGIDGIVGLEYKIPRAPIAFSLDIKPFVEFNTNGGVWTSFDPGLGLKVAF